MNTEHTKALMKKYPFLRPEPPMTLKDGTPFIHDLMNFGFECGDGWYPLLDSCCAKIMEIINNNDGLGFKADQIKEKYGGLRFYFTLKFDANMPIGQKEKLADAIDEIITMAEEKSFEVCETCSAPGKLEEVHGWMFTVCKNHVKR